MLTPPICRFTSVGDYIWLNKELPSAQSWTALISICGGAYGYMAVEGGTFTTSSLLWGVFYVFVLSFEMLYVKHVVTNVKMTTWTQVLYNNAISLFLNLPFIIMAQVRASRVAHAASAAFPIAAGSH